MIIPAKRHYDSSTGTVYLWFDKNDPDAPTNGWYRVRGGVCWPAMAPGRHAENHMGVLVVCVQEVVRPFRASVVAWDQFETVSSTLSMASPGAYPGIAPFVTEAFSRYVARGYYWAGLWEAARKWLMETVRDETIQPCPDWIETQIRDPQQAVAGLMHALDTGALMLADGGPPMSDPQAGGMEPRLRTQRQHPDDVAPVAWALACAVWGMQQSPPD